MKVNSALININSSIVKIPEKSNHSVNPEEKFQKDFDERFGGCLIVDDVSYLPLVSINQAVDRRVIRAWVDHWIFENSDLDDDFKRTADAFLENQFNQAKGL